MIRAKTRKNAEGQKVYNYFKFNVIKINYKYNNYSGCSTTQRQINLGGHFVIEILKGLNFLEDCSRHCMFVFLIPSLTMIIDKL